MNSQPYDIILAKSLQNGGTPLEDHLRHVAHVISIFQRHFQVTISTLQAIHGAVLHDIGKVHPAFQRKIHKIKGGRLSERKKWIFNHRHEITSLAFLPCFPKKDWELLVDMVVAHHKPVEGDKRGLGLLDMSDDMIASHILDWEEWYQDGIQILKNFDIPEIEISIEEAIEAINFAKAHCKKKKNGASRLRGLLMAADHFASAFGDETAAALKGIFTKPNFSFYLDPKRKSNLYPLSNKPFDDERHHTMVVAPTGAGKTDFLIKRCKGRVFYTLPFQASINAMYDRIKEAVHKFQPEAHIRFQHGSSRLKAEGKEEEMLQNLSGASVKVLTPHQLASLVFATAGYESVLLDIENTDVILDEIHTYSEATRSLVLEIVKALIHLKCRVHIGTATMPKALYDKLLEILGGKSSVYEVKLPENELDSFDRHLVHKIQKCDVDSIVRQAISEEDKLLLVCNTVSEAQQYYERYVVDHPIGIPVMLIHSRFRRKDRVDKEVELLTEFNGDDSKKFGKGHKPCLVIATQVVEVSLDISFDRMITECAPLDSLIQRFGRVNRKRTNKTLGKYKPVHVIKPSGNVLPYRMDLLKSSFAQLPDDFSLLRERELQNKINAVFPSLESSPIDIHVLHKNGEYLLKELTHNQNAVLVKALEIDGVICILESDRDKYEEADRDEKLKLEIPMSYKIISKHIKTLEQLECGSSPFVIRQPFEDYARYGVKLNSEDTFL